MSGWRRLAESVYAKTVVIALISFLGIAGGIYVGYAWTSGNHESTEAQTLFENADIRLQTKFGPGDAFPLEHYVDFQGESGSFEELLRDRETLIIFAEWRSAQCLDLFRFAQTTLLKRLKPGVQVVVLIDKQSGPIPAEYGGLINGMIPLRIGNAYWRATYNTVILPTIVGIDNSGIVRHVQLWYAGFVDRELVEFFVSAAR